MKKFTQSELEAMSIFGINSLVAKIMFPNRRVTSRKRNNCDAVDVSGYGLLDYCNSPSDAWPIIVENGINIFYEYRRKKWDAWYREHKSRNENPLRAAMITFILMQQDNGGK